MPLLKLCWEIRHHGQCRKLLAIEKLDQNDDERLTSRSVRVDFTVKLKQLHKHDPFLQLQLDSRIVTSHVNCLTWRKNTGLSALARTGLKVSSPSLLAFCYNSAFKLCQDEA